MSEEILVWLHDIQKEILQIEEFYASTQKSFITFRSNAMLRKAIERNLEIAVEALNRILDKDPNFPISNARKIIGFRNRLIHAYDAVDTSMVWAIFVNHLPLLKAELILKYGF